MKKLSFLNANFYNSFQDLVHYRILGCQTFEYKAKLKKDLFYLGPK